MGSPAWATYEIIDSDNPDINDCYLIGSWDDASKTCTMTTDIDYTGLSATDGIWILSNNITLDGNWHFITGFDRDLLQCRRRNGRQCGIRQLDLREFNRHKRQYLE
jgi:hypothetical protein